MNEQQQPHSAQTTIPTAVKKRDGRTVAFTPAKILNDLRSAQRVFNVEFRRTPQEIVDAIAVRVQQHAELTSMQLFDIVQDELHESPAVLAAFREYKQIQNTAIDNSTNLDFQLSRLNSDKVRNENGNKDSRTFIVQRDIVAGTITKAKGLAMFPDDVRRAHIKGLIHIHDLDRSPFQGMPNCSLPDFEYMLAHGFTLGNAPIESPKSIGVAATLLVQLLGAISGEQYGGISIHEIDRLLEPYAQLSLEKNRDMFAEVTEDFEAPARKKTIKDIYDAMQAFEYQVNTLTTSAAQTPFTSISMGQTTSWLGREIQKAILAVREKGMSGETAIFPKILYFVDDGVNSRPGDPNYDIKQAAMRCSRKRIYPDLVSAPRIREAKDGQLITPMGCRSFLHPWKDQIVGRNNLGVVSINLPRIAIQSEGDTPTFFSLLDEAMDLTIKALKIREDGILNTELESAPIMYTQGGLGDPTGKQTVRDWYTGEREKASSISMGYIGIHNAMVALTGDTSWHNDGAHRELSYEILRAMNRRVEQAQGDFHAQMSVYSTPSESLCDRFDELDRARFGTIEGVNDRGYYENSFHFPSYVETNPVRKIHFEAPYMELTPGGFMFYVEAPNLAHNPAAFEALWDEAYENVGYFGINSPVDTCLLCNFEGEFTCDAQGYVCPSCGNRDENQASVTRRLCGYLGSPMKRPVVAGKQEEISSRVKHF
ncbi:anaerobic ribonucleoside-triphosphate reductase [Corynebacterium breve]|uniref:Anaerobic ribonucleoside-triphosphate reductase n=1 Tax=Corynebacterium breve TaxID=3049799 RepID=A0ABY8VEP6_9CORY|nr:anaerobic ribonucleoside-triphosphate reductase [Corynebacterium breve]WIM67225.1 anaerobic ribonucleoside-triphosphate reductase [Corynebacterium breve]